jgi:hypothetical protein
MPHASNPDNMGAHVSRSRSSSPDISESASYNRLHSTHQAQGYRAGLLEGKSKTLQTAFDDSYPVGAAIGLRVGRVLGLLAGLKIAADKQEEPLLEKINELEDKVEHWLARADIMFPDTQDGEETDGGVNRAEGVVSEFERAVQALSVEAGIPGLEIRRP